MEGYIRAGLSQERGQSLWFCSTMFKRIREKLDDLTLSFDHFYFIPLFGLFCWYGLVFGLMGIWIAHGSKKYPKYDENETPLPLERVGMILQPGFFIAFVVIHAAVFCTSMYLEYYHRKIGKLIKFIKPTIQRRLAYASLVIGIISQLFLIAQAVVGTVYVRKYARAKSHYAVLLATFAILVMISLGLNFTNYYIMGQYYRKYVNGERWNKFTISFVLKITWLFVTLVLAVVCCGFYVRGLKNVSSVFEWIFHFWYGLLLAFWTYDLYPLTELRALRKREGQAETGGARQAIRNKLSLRSLSQKLTGKRDEEKDEAITSIVPISSLDGNSTRESAGELDSPVGFNYVTQYPQMPPEI